MSAAWTIEQLIECDVAFMATNWIEDPSAVDGAYPGHRADGETPMVLCGDVFWWACADGEDITEALLPEFNRAVDDCGGDIVNGATLYCCRRRGMRPQGALYSYLPREVWPLFDACGPEREIDGGNSWKPGEYVIRQQS